ncbi:MAG: hypothetical protein QW692_00010 [Nitrososphaerota archaeon]
MNRPLWQPALSIIISSLILAFILTELALITVTFGLTTAVAVSLMVSKRRRYIRSIAPTKRSLGMTLLIIMLFFATVISLAAKHLAGPIFSCIALTTFFCLSLIPAITDAVASSSSMRFKPRIYSQIIASIIAGGLLVMFYLGINLLEVVGIIGS